MTDSHPTSTLDLAVCDYRLCVSESARDRQQFCRQFGDAFREHGFAVIANPAIDSMALSEAFALCERLFALPLETKQSFEVPESKGNRGYVGFAVERAVGALVGDLKEFWHFGQPVLPDGSPLRANRWPTGPTVQNAQEHFTQLFLSYERMADELLSSIANYLDQPRDWLSSMITGGDSILRLIHYPPIASDAPAGAIRAAAHEDINLITLLAEGTSGGLELFTRDKQWMPVQSLRGQLVINAGDMLQRITHGRIRSTTHRVVNPANAHIPRYSMPFFTHPRPDVLLSPLPPEEGYSGPTHTAITAGAFLQERLQAITSPKTP